MENYKVLKSTFYIFVIFFGATMSYFKKKIYYIEIIFLNLLFLKPQLIESYDLGELPQSFITQ